MKDFLAIVTMQFFATQKQVPGSRKTANFLHIMLLTEHHCTCREIGTAPTGSGSSLQSAQEQGPRETTKTLEISAKITKIYVSLKSREGGKAVRKD